jgi:hypothetical protein
MTIGVRRRVSKGVEDCRRLLTLQVGHFRGGHPTGRGRVGQDGPGQDFRESMATQCHTSVSSRRRRKMTPILTKCGESGRKSLNMPI